MIDLTLTAPLEGRAPVELGATTLAAADPGPLTLIMPFAGQTEATGAALEAAIGLGVPPVGQTRTAGDVRVIWFGRNQWLVAGAQVAADVPAAVTDQSDGWVAVTLAGPLAADTLARLTPIDLRPASFGPGATARTDLQHMPASITRIGAEAFLILTFRSMAQTLWHDLADALRGVAARQGG